MDRSLQRMVAAVLLVMLLVATQEMAKTTVEAKLCESPSGKYKGVCYRTRNCDIVCQTEGFPAGECRGFIPRRCICLMPC